MSDPENKQQRKKVAAGRAQKPTRPGADSRPIVETAETTSLALRAKPKPPAAPGRFDDKGPATQQQRQGARVRVDSLERKRARRNRAEAKADPDPDPAKDPSAQPREGGPSKRSASRSRSRRRRSASGQRSRRGSRDGEERQSRRRSRSRNNGNQRSRSRSENRRRSWGSRVGRSLSRLRGRSPSASPVRERSSQLIRPAEPSIVYYKKGSDRGSVEFHAKEVRRGQWGGRDALYFRIDFVLGRKVRDLDRASFTLRFQPHRKGGRHNADGGMVKSFYPETARGPSNPENREHLRGGEAGFQAGVGPGPSVNLTGRDQVTSSTVVPHRCCLDVTLYRGARGVQVELWKEGKKCTFPSRVQVQLVVLYSERNGLDIMGDMDLKGADGADGAWKEVSTSSWPEKPSDFEKWTEQVWRENGDNTPLVGRMEPAVPT